MVRFLVLSSTPTDIAAFKDHYYNVRMPLAKLNPGVRSMIYNLEEL